MELNQLIPIVGKVTVTGPMGTVEEETIKVGEVVAIGGDTAEVSYELGYTMNLGNYQSARFHVGLKMPSNIDHESLDKNYEFVKDWVDTKMAKAIADAKKDLA